jgi:hypothetical protein
LILKLNEEFYAILFVCIKNCSENIINYLKKKYGTELLIGEVIEPEINGKYICEFIKLNNLSL